MHGFKEEYQPFFVPKSTQEWERGNRAWRASPAGRLTHSEMQSTLQSTLLRASSWYKVTAANRGCCSVPWKKGSWPVPDFGQRKAESQPQLFYWFASWTNQLSSDCLAHILDSALKVNMRDALYIAFFLHSVNQAKRQHRIIAQCKLHTTPQALKHLLLSPSSGCTVCPSLALLHMLLNSLNQFLLMKTKPLYLNQGTPFLWNGMVWISYGELKGNLRKI